MSDPKKNFLCPAQRHVINDIQRKNGNDSICQQCEFELYKESSEKKILSEKEIDVVFPPVEGIKL